MSEVHFKVKRTHLTTFPWYFSFQSNSVLAFVGDDGQYVCCFISLTYLWTELSKAYYVQRSKSNDSLPHGKYAMKRMAAKRLNPVIVESLLCPEADYLLGCWW